MHRLSSFKYSTSTSKEGSFQSKRCPCFGTSTKDWWNLWSFTGIRCIFYSQYEKELPSFGTKWRIQTQVGFCKWEFKRYPFGLAQAPAYFRRLINEVLAPFDFACGYLDDTLIFSPDIETHLQHLESIFAQLQEVGLKLKTEKCNFIKAHIQYLGHIISREGITPVPEKLDSIDDMPSPRTLKEVKQFWDW